MGRRKNWVRKPYDPPSQDRVILWWSLTCDMKKIFHFLLSSLPVIQFSFLFKVRSKHWLPPVCIGWPSHGDFHGIETQVCPPQSLSLRFHLCRRPAAPSLSQADTSHSTSDWEWFPVQSGLASPTSAFPNRGKDPKYRADVRMVVVNGREWGS